MTTTQIQLVQGESPGDFMLTIANEQLVAFTLPNSPDDDPWGVEVVKTITLDAESVDAWIDQVLPSSNNYSCLAFPPACKNSHVYLGQDTVPTFGSMAVLYSDGPYYNHEGHHRSDFHGDSLFEYAYYVVAIHEKGGSFDGAILLAVCIPDFLLGVKQRGVLLVQIAKSNGICKIVVPRVADFCLCQNSWFQDGDSHVERMKKWYVTSGAKELIQLMDRFIAYQE